RDRDRQAGPQGRAREDARRGRRGAEAHGRGRQRPRRGRRVRRRPVPRPPRGLGPRAHPALRERRRRDRRVAPRVLDRDADARRGRAGTGGEPIMTTLTEADFAALRETRTHRPFEVQDAFANRRRRDLLRGDGRLLIVAADHPARGSLAVGSDDQAMADRYDLLDRLATALANPAVDGVLGTPDIVDDLAALGLLDDKIVVGSMNRGGLRGAAFEMDDRYTGYDVPTMVSRGIDFAKSLVRVNLADAGTAPTLEATAQAVTASAA